MTSSSGVAVHPLRQHRLKQAPQHITADMPALSLEHGGSPAREVAARLHTQSQAAVPEPLRRLQAEQQRSADWELPPIVVLRPRPGTAGRADGAAGGPLHVRKTAPFRPLCDPAQIVCHGLGSQHFLGVCTISPDVLVPEPDAAIIGWHAGSGPAVD